MPRGGKWFVPSEKDRATVLSMCAYGIPEAEICRVIGCAEKTLRRHFRSELDTAQTNANAKVAETAYKMATSGKEPSATFFWLKCRAGWKEKSAIEVTGADGGPVTFVDLARKLSEKR